MDDLSEKMPIFYGAVTVGERGQIAVPAEARRAMDITPGKRLVVLGSPDNRLLMMLKAEAVTEILSHTTELLSQFEQGLKDDSTDDNEEGTK